MEMKSKLYLRIILLSYGMMDIYMIFTVYGFLSEKMSQTKKRERERERERPGWTYISGPGHFLIQKFHIV